MEEIIKKIDEEIEMYKNRISVRQGANYHDESERIIRFEERLNEAIRIKEIIQAEQKDLMTDYHQAREIIKQYCQNEDCKECPYPLSVIRCGEEVEYKGEQKEDNRIESHTVKTKGVLIRESNESLAEALRDLITCCYCDFSYDKMMNYLNQPVESEKEASAEKHMLHIQV